jgi:predicted metal-dependent hydrolase
VPDDAPQALFDRAVASFNARDFYEAHEDWETLWHEAEGAERRWLQGLIQIAAAFFHFERGFFASGYAKLMAEGHAKIEGYAGPTHGMDFPALFDALRPWRAHGRRVADGLPLAQDAPLPLPRITPLQDPP